MGIDDKFYPIAKESEDIDRVPHVIRNGSNLCTAGGTQRNERFNISTNRNYPVGSPRINRIVLIK